MDDRGVQTEPYSDPRVPPLEGRAAELFQLLQEQRAHSDAAEARIAELLAVQEQLKRELDDLQRGWKAAVAAESARSQTAVAEATGIVQDKDEEILRLERALALYKAREAAVRDQAQAFVARRGRLEAEEARIASAREATDRLRTHLSELLAAAKADSASAASRQAQLAAREEQVAEAEQLMSQARVELRAETAARLEERWQLEGDIHRLELQRASSGADQDDTRAAVFTASLEHADQLSRRLRERDRQLAAGQAREATLKARAEALELTVSRLEREKTALESACDARIASLIKETDAACVAAREQASAAEAVLSDRRRKLSDSAAVERSQLNDAIAAVAQETAREREVAASLRFRSKERADLVAEQEERLDALRKDADKLQRLVAARVALLRRAKASLARLPESGDADIDVDGVPLTDTELPVRATIGDEPLLDELTLMLEAEAAQDLASGTL
jgi:hypothetical protein